MATRPSVEPVYPDLAGRVAVVTGGSKGIGAAAARALARNGCLVAVVARDRAPIDRLVAELTAGGATAAGYSTDCTSGAALEALRNQVEAELGPAGIVLPFAGGFGRQTPTQDISEEEWRQVIDANLTATFLTVKAFLPGMIERRRGAIVTMASNAARLLDIPLTASYAAAKAGVVMFSRHVALEAGRHNVRVNCIAPATTLSERVVANLSPERLAEIAALAPLGRVGSPEDSANAAVFLASDASAWLTGVTLDVTGGRVML